MNEKKLVALLRTKSEEGFRTLMRKYKKPIYWHIRRLVVSHDDAQDATQETFIRVFRSIDGFKDGSFVAWVYRIATNEALRIIDNRKKTPLTADDENSATNIPSGEYVNYDDLLAVKLQRAILSLPMKQQMSFNMRYYDELAYEDIAKAIGSTPAAAKVNYHLAKEKIIDYMKSHD